MMTRTRRHTFTRLGAVLVLFTGMLVAARHADAQATTGGLIGRVRDTGSGVIPGATVEALETRTGEVRVAVTNERGEFVFTGVPIGLYEVSVSLEGFKRAVHRGVQVNVDTQVRLDDLVLEVGGVNESVVVTGVVQATVETDRSVVGNLVLGKQVLDMPLNSRNALELMGLTAGVDVGQGSGYYQVSGSRDDMVGYLVEGNVSQSLTYNTAVGVPPIDSVAEFLVKTSLATADSGLASAQVSLAIKSGTNAYNGSAYEFYRGTGLDARNPFNPTGERADLERHQFGASLGGPISRDRLFFFVNYEGTRRRSDETTRSTVPTMAERQGDFSASGVTVVDPFNGRRPFPGNQIPADRVTPFARALMAYIPEPNLPGTIGNYFANLPSRSDDHAVVARADFRLGNRQRYMFLVRTKDLESESPGPVPLVGGEFSILENRAYTVRHDYTLRPNVLNQFSAAYTRSSVDETTQNRDRNILQELGLSSLKPELPTSVNGFIDLNWRGYTRLRDAGNLPQIDVNDVFTVNNDLTWTRSRHNMKFGFSWLRGRVENVSVLRQRPLVDIRNTHTGHTFGDVLLATPYQILLEQGVGLVKVSRDYVAGYAMDDWRVTPDLTVNAGVRYEFYTLPVEAQNRMAAFDFATGGLVVSSTNGEFPPNMSPVFTVNPPVPIRTSAEAGLPRGLSRTDKNNIMPRVGFAYRLFGDNSTVLRGGYGIFYSPIRLLVRLQGASRTPPFLVRARMFNTNRNTTQSLDQLLAAGPSVDISGSIVYGTHPDFQDARNQQWNLTVERELPWAIGLRASYVGNRGDFLPVRLNFNQSGTHVDPVTGARSNFTPYPRLGSIQIHTAAARSQYHAGEFEVRRRFTSGLAFQASWTWGKLLNMTDRDNIIPQDSYNLEGDWSDANYQRRHMVKVNAMYDLPFGHGQRWLDRTGLVDALLGGWRLSAIGKFYTGQRLSPEFSDTELTDIRNGRPDVVCDPNNGPKTVDRWFDTSCFVLPPLQPGVAEDTRFGNAARNLVVGPGLNLVDLTLQKSFRVRRGQSLTVRMDAYNAFNTTNLGTPETDLSLASAGAILSTSTPARQFQFGIRWTF